MTDASPTKFQRTPFVLLIVALLSTALCHAGRGAMVGSAGWWFEVGFVLSIATAISIVIAQACDPFSDAAAWVGQKLQIPESVRGATLDAIASSMPELFTGLFFVVVALSSDLDQQAQLMASSEGYGSTIATCAGSSIYNLILIPALCAIMVSYARPQRPAVEIESDVLFRDGVWTFCVQAGLLVFLCQPELSWWMGALAITAYLTYIAHLTLSTWRYRAQLKARAADLDPVADEIEDSCEVFFNTLVIRLTWRTAVAILVLATAIAAFACYFLVELTNFSAERLGVPPFFVAVILTAAVSSVPDTLLSLNSARRGDDSGAVSNVFGSNIFDVCVGMSIPLLVCCYLNDWQPVQLVGPDGNPMPGVVGLRIFLFLLTTVALSIMWTRRRVSRKSGWVLVGLYALFTTYAVLGGLGIVGF